MNISQLVSENAAASPQQYALIFEHEKYTYQELDTLSSQTAAALSGLNIGSGDRVALMLANHPQFVVTYLAVQKIGAIAVLINPEYKAAEISFILNNAECCTLVTTGELRWELSNAKLPHLQHVILIYGTGQEGDLLLADLVCDLSTSFHTVDVDDDTPSTLLYTSGTTGTPKGVVLSHGNLNTTTQQCAEAFSIQKNDRVLHCMPVYHSYGLTTIMLPSFRAGATVVLSPNSEADAVLQIANRFEITIFCAVPMLF
ncbi:MAG: long-chain fatty acid--CoA ligase, partial [Candidatus Electrothrix sp. AW2]|nr:long-chain fatty acid--CoA ligase [Candidatus Electrothrix gigas]